MLSSAAIEVHGADLKQLAEQAVTRALSLGAADAEAVASESEEFHLNIRLGQVEQLIESGSRALGLRVFFSDDDGSGGSRTASTSTSDLSAEGVNRIIDSAVQLARVTGVDPFAGLPERGAFGSNDVDALRLYFDDVDQIAPGRAP